MQAVTLAQTLGNNPPRSAAWGQGPVGHAVGCADDYFPGRQIDGDEGPFRVSLHGAQDQSTGNAVEDTRIHDDLGARHAPRALEKKRPAEAEGGPPASMLHSVVKRR